MKTVKLPVVLQNNKQVEMGVMEPDKCTAFGIFMIDQIEAIVQTHDDLLGSEQINNEATFLQLKSSTSFYIPMFIEDVLSIINSARLASSEDHIKL